MRNFSTNVPDGHVVSIVGEFDRIAKYGDVAEARRFYEQMQMCERILRVAMEEPGSFTPSEQAVVDSFDVWIRNTHRNGGVFIYVNMTTGVSVVFLPDYTGEEYVLTPAAEHVCTNLIHEHRQKREETHRSASF